MEDNIKYILKKYFIKFFLFFLFYLSFRYLLSKGWYPGLPEIFQFITGFCFFILFKLSEEKKEYTKEIPLIFLTLFIFALPLGRNPYFLKKFFFLFVFTPLILRFERLKFYLEENFILKDIVYSVLYLYIFFMIAPYKFPFFPEVWIIFAGFFLLEILEYFSEKVKFGFEEKKGVMTYSKYMGFYPAIFFILGLYFSIFFIFLSFWRGLNFTFVFPIVLLFGLLKAMLFIFFKILNKKSGFAEFLKSQSVFFKYTVYMAFILESILNFLNLTSLKI